MSAATPVPPGQKADYDVQETREWTDALSAVIEK